MSTYQNLKLTTMDIGILHKLHSLFIIDQVYCWTAMQSCKCSPVNTVKRSRFYFVAFCSAKSDSKFAATSHPNTQDDSR